MSPGRGGVKARAASSRNCTTAGEPHFVNPDEVIDMRLRCPRTMPAGEARVHPRLEIASIIYVPFRLETPMRLSLYCSVWK